MIILKWNTSTPILKFASFVLFMASFGKNRATIYAARVAPSVVGITNEQMKNSLPMHERFTVKNTTILNVVFFTVATKVCIICPIHGEFLQTPLEHLRGYGCPKCAGVRYWNTEDYITKAKEVWGETYDYSQTRYNSFSDKVIIICPKHGAWECRPLDHIHGKHGCPRCAAMQRRKKVCGVGVIKDEGVVCNEPAYRAWRGMLKRCYNNPTEAYKNCVVCDDWLTYDNFREWYNPRYKEGWELDKDWLSRGNKIYSPETCCVIPPRLNQLIVRKLYKKHNLPHGVYLNSGSGRYFSTIGAKDETIYVGGGFNTPEEAFQAYKEAKESYIRREVEKYKDELEPRVYEAMMKYEV